jgi:hypothetical protein
VWSERLHAGVVQAETNGGVETMKANHIARPGAASFGLIQLGIVILALISAFVHLVLLNMRMGRIDIPFLLNGLGFLALLAAHYLPLPFAKDHPELVRWLFIGYTAVTILAWLFIGVLPEIQSGRGYNDGLGIFTSVVELALIVLLLIEGRRSVA